MLQFFRKSGIPFLFLILLLGVFSKPFASYPSTATHLRIGAQSAVLMDAVSDQILYEKNPTLKMSPASFVKILTLYTALDMLRARNLTVDNRVTVSEKAWKTRGSRMFLNMGERVSVEDLLKGIAIMSGNDASVALAEYLAGSEDAFVMEMSQTAQRLGLKDSQFRNAHGMPAEGQYMTAFDMALLARWYIEDHPEALTLHSTRGFEHHGIQQPNRNTLLHQNIGVDGLITGYVEVSGYHLAATAKRGNQRMIAVVMGCKTTKQRAREARKLLEYGFRNFSTIRTFEKDALFGPEKVIRGKQNQVDLVPAEEGWVTVPKGKEKTIGLTTEAPPYLKAPVQKGQRVGRLLIQSEGKVLKEIPLLSSSDVPKGIYLLWTFIGGGMLSLTLVGLIVFWLIRQSKRKRFYR